MNTKLYSNLQSFIGDEQKLLQRMAGQMEIWEECVRLFSREEVVAEMDAALQEGNLQLFYESVHKLKGNLANFGFESAAEKASWTLLAVKEKDDARMRSWYQRLKDEYLQIVERIDDTE